MSRSGVLAGETNLILSPGLIFAGKSGSVTYYPHVEIENLKWKRL